MKRVKVSDNFYLDEFIPKRLYKKYGKKSIWFLDPRLIGLAQGFRDFIGVPVTINNWATGGKRQNSGYRTPGTSVGAYYSQHKYGRAIDVQIKLSELHLQSYEELREVIRQNWPYFRDLGLTTIEKGTKTWLHMDMRQIDLNPGPDSDLFQVNYY